LPGWNILASYSYINARVTNDNTVPIGNQLTGVPAHRIALWTTYQLQAGRLKGLGFGVGVDYTSARQGDLANSFELEGYVLANAALFYERNQVRLGLNFRNLFNTEYTNSRGRFGAPSSAGVPGEPFSVIGSVSVKF
jgi:iron complex outermembrane recepter protein